MKVLEAKDFLVSQTAQQAVIDGVPFSDIEKRMMYFTESDDRCPDPIALNGEFETQCDSTVYEEKVSRLMTHAYRRLKRGNSAELKRWKDAFQVLRKGDHYILLFWRPAPLEKSARDWMWQGLAVFAIVAIGALFRLFFGGARRGELAPIDRYMSLSPTAQHMLQILLRRIVILRVEIKQTQPEI